MNGQPRCNWCGVFVARWMPAFTWHRNWRTGDFIDGRWVEQGEHLCWTDPQRLCPDCAHSASAGWCDVFAELSRRDQREKGKRVTEHMTERVTIDVEPGIVDALRRSSAALDFTDYPNPVSALADAIEAALPQPEPAVGSVVQLSGTPGWPLYARTDGSGVRPCPWVGLTGDALGDWDSWGTLREGGPVVVFDGAALGVGG